MPGPTPTLIPYTSRADWLKLRAEDVTSTDAAALFGLSPYKSRLELWTEKRRPCAADRAESERMFWGARLEDPIAGGLAELYGLEVRPFKVYARHGSVRGMGSSFDYVITGCDPAKARPEHREKAAAIADLVLELGHGILELKNVDGLVARRSWDRSGDVVEAPLHIELQVQHQLAVSGLGWCAIGALVGGNEHVLELRERDEAAIAKICGAITEFWRSVAADMPPDADYQRDLAALRALYARTDENAVLTPDAEAALLVLCEDYDALAARLRELEARKRELQARILDTVKAAPAAEVGPFKVSARTVVRRGYTVETASYRDLRVTKKAPVAAPATA